MSSSSMAHRQPATPIIIEGQDELNAVVFLVDGKHIVSGDGEGKIQCWRVEDGMEVGTPIVAESGVVGVAVSRDGQWIITGTNNGFVTVWNAETHEKAIELRGHAGYWVRAIDVSPDGKKIVTGSYDKTVCVWSLSTGERILGPWRQNGLVVATRFSPGGSLIATAYFAKGEGVQIYDGVNGTLLVNARIQVAWFNNCLAWASNAKQLFTLSGDGVIHTIDISTGTTLSQQHIHGAEDVQCIAFAGNFNRFMAASADRRISLWNSTTYEQIGSIIELTHKIWSMAISANYDLVACGEKRMSIFNLRDMLLSRCMDEQATLVTANELSIQLAEFQQAHEEKDSLIQSLRAQAEASSGRITYLENTIEELRNQLVGSRRIVRQQEEILSSWEVKSGHLEKTIEGLREELAQSQTNAKETIGSLQSNLHTQQKISKDQIALMERNIQDLRAELTDSLQKAARISCAHEQMYKCESLFTKGRIRDAAESLSEMMNATPESTMTDSLVDDWLPDFIDRCTKELEIIGDEASRARKHKDAVAAYSALLSISSSTTDTLLMKWARATMVGGSVQEALSTARKLKHPIFPIYRVMCETLEGSGRFIEAIECFRWIRDALPDDAATHDMLEWGQSFQKRCVQRLEKLGDAARDSLKHEEASKYYLDILLLDPNNLDVLLKHSNEVIEIDPSSYKGYEGKHAALHNMGRYREAFEAFRVMVSKVEQSPDSNIRKLLEQYVDATSAIQREINKAIRNIPTVLIDTDTGRLYDKAQQGDAFKEMPIYDELRSSMTTHLNASRIRTEVKKFYQYVMFSHRWQPQEPTFQDIANTSVYKLPLSPKFSKLQNFCKLVCTLQFKWAWTDTCCVNQLDKGVQSESVVAMFKWYRGSALTIVHLLGVLSASRAIGRLRRSIWNMRGWTYQEYLASNFVQFYTEDWKPYLGLKIFNHKESPDILSEMEEAMNFSTSQLTTLQPGLDRAREKLYLASRRQTTREEDIAYSLFGIFNVALPVIYGEGLHAVGRLLEHVLTRSGDVTVLAWTGTSGSHHSYLPIDLTVYNQIVPPHVPPSIETTEIESMTTALHSSPHIDLQTAIALYDRLYDLQPPSLVAGRLRLSGLAFPLDDLVIHPEPDPESDLPVYRATTPMLGDVVIITATDLSGMGRLILIHPWTSPLLDQDFSHAGEPQFDPTTCALRLVVRLRQPFGGLLLAPRARTQYRRVATDSLIMVRVRDDASLTDLMACIRTVDIHQEIQPLL